MLLDGCNPIDQTQDNNGLQEQENFLNYYIVNGGSQGSTVMRDPNDPESFIAALGNGSVVFAQNDENGILKIENINGIDYINCKIVCGEAFLPNDAGDVVTGSNEDYLINNQEILGLVPLIGLDAPGKYSDVVDAINNSVLKQFGNTNTSGTISEALQNLEGLKQKIDTRPGATYTTEGSNPDYYVTAYDVDCASCELKKCATRNVTGREI